ncbi:hypothetical protein QDY65_03605 [Pyrococcus kukulkanii]|uniref:SLAC1 family transporter n=1 Tax=Pyrococcus kukulkanii TaxID=1609559 RepID=UPI003565D612
MFPLGAYTSATLKIASLLSSPTIKVFGVLLYGMLFVLWLITGVRTIIHLTSSPKRGSSQLRTVTRGSPGRLASPGTVRVPSGGIKMEYKTLAFLPLKASSPQRR